MLALECRLCGEANAGNLPDRPGEIDAVRRPPHRNLMVAWHSQLLELLGAMGNWRPSSRRDGVACSLKTPSAIPSAVCSESERADS